jgi:outer membrane protein assembly factor BamA
MRSLLSILCWISVANAAWAWQETVPPPDSLVHVRTLTILSSDLPDAERIRTARALEGRTYRVDELRERVLHNLENSGYLKATVEEPRFTRIMLETVQPRYADVSIQVSPGTRYRLEAIIFEGGLSFSAEQLRDTFHAAVGDEFNGSAIGKGLESLRQLYSTDGHINFTAVPQLRIEQDRGSVELIVSMEEGPVFNFGRLHVEGKEIRAGKADALLSAWAPLSGKAFNAPLLSKWLVENADFLPNDGQSPLRHVEVHLDISTHRADIGLRFP